ncbi:HAD family hydrolase [Sphingomonas changnyeongensis]|uniref:HAD family hydrolase n=1 Tax=Sphingomonas changnyeongensis TaxID=2698679 RepID=A0A7Z2S732_9SPHN|nr:HAD family hydrolase [Sphingomonas changnyeongensis]QHL89971.1 HAD family hydrolase [Sphingomonas changnyeongensis]
MSRPLLITDCDEVLLHMVRHFGDWLGEAHDIDFALGSEFARALTRRACGSPVAPAEIWPLLDGFFVTEMHRQTPVPHARETLAAIAEHADIVVLTNLGDHHQDGRARQLEAIGIRHRVVCNQGGKGAPVARLLDEYGPGAAVFVDDLAVHHESVAQHAPDVQRLHMVAEPALAPMLPPAPHAHARIDCWREAGPWIAARLGIAQPGLTLPATPDFPDQMMEPHA